MTVLIEGAGLPLKKQFMQRSFYPQGTEVCTRLGILRPSEDVREREVGQAHAELLSGSTRFSKFLMNRVDWYVSGAEVSDQLDDSKHADRDLSDHLAAFGLALLVDALQPLRGTGHDMLDRMIDELEQQSDE